MKPIWRKALILGALLVVNQSFAAQLHPKTFQIIRCEFIYSYTAQLMQLHNNNGAAVALFRRSAMMTTANFMLNEEKGVIAAWKIEKFKEIRPSLKRALDTGELNAIQEAGNCDKTAIPLAKEVRDTQPVLWGKSFDELHEGFFLKMKTSMGL